MFCYLSSLMLYSISNSIPLPKCPPASKYYDNFSDKVLAVFQHFEIPCSSPRHLTDLGNDIRDKLL